MNRQCSSCGSRSHEVGRLQDEAKLMREVLKQAQEAIRINLVIASVKNEAVLFTAFKAIEAIL